MIKHLRFFVLNLLVLVCAAVMAQTTGDAVYKSLTFPDDNSAKNGVQNYTSTWTAMNGDDSWTITNFNNNKWGSNWTYIKCGSKSAASTGSIATDNAFEEAVTKVVLDVKSATVANVTSLTLIVASDKDFENVVETSTGDLGKNTTFTGDLTLTVSAPAKNLYYKVVVECSKAKGNGIFSLNGVKYYSTTGDISTKLSFGEDIDGAKYVVRQGNTFEGKTATVSPSDAKGTISYSSDNEAVATVDATTGAVTLGSELGKAVITATFTPEEGYMSSSVSYTIDYRQAADPTKVLFATNEDSFNNLDNLGYNVEGDCVFVDLNGDNYTFNVHNAMLNYYGHGLQLKKASATDETAQGYVISPVFDKFEYGYRVTVKYEEGHGVDLTCPNYPTEVAAIDDAQGTVYMDVPYADGIFQILGGSQVSYVSSIELTPLDKPADKTIMSFPEAEYNVNLGDAFEAPKAKVTNELGTEIDGLPLIYTSDNEDVASVDENNGNVTINAVGTAKITAYFIGNTDYAASQAEYTLNVTEKQLSEPGFYYEEPALEASVLSTLTTKQQWFHNPNNLTLVFTSSDENVATVDEEGNVTTLAAGTTVIKASFEGNDEYLPGESSYTLTVTDKRNESSLSFSESEYTANMTVDGFFRTKLINENELTPIVYTSSNPEVAEIGEVPETVKLNSVGETIITATFEGNSFYKPTSASYKLIVINEVVDGINSISLNAVPADAKVYNLNGQSVNAKQLKKGVYVVNGKKVVVK